MNLKQETYKLSTLNNFYFQEGGKDQGVFIREKCSLICDLLSSEQKLIQERSEAFEYRKKFYPGTGPTAQQAGITDPGTAFVGSTQTTNNPSAPPGAYGNYGMGSTSKGYSGPGLGQTSTSKTYSPYSGVDEGFTGGSAPTSMGSTSMGSMGSASLKSTAITNSWEVVTKGIGAAAVTISSMADMLGNNSG